jgi:Icc-related predicted phosphoesterase
LDKQTKESLSIAIASDLHEHFDIVTPEVDVLVIPGDMTYRGKRSAIKEFNSWLADQPAKTKIVIPGNHDLCFDETKVEFIENVASLIQNAIVINDESCEIDGFVFFGSGYTPYFCNWGLNIRTENELQTHWDKAPEKVDCFITHGPPFGILDKTAAGVNAGSQSLRDTVTRIEPQLSCFGHIHEAYGVVVHGKTTFINGSICTINYRAINPVQTFTLKRCK